MGDGAHPGPVSVLIVDDQAVFREAAAAVVRSTPGFVVVGEAASGEQAVELASSLNPAIVLMDVNMDGIDGIEATRRITSAGSEAVVILLSTYEVEDLRADALATGAAGYVNKDDLSPHVLRRAWEASSRRAETPSSDG